MESNKAQINDVYKAYARIVDSMFEVYKVQKVTGVGYINTDYLNVNGRDSFPREELQAMIDAYIGDIEMIRKCEVSLGHPDRVDMEIVDRLKSLSNDVRNYTFYRDDPRGVTESYSVSRKTLDQCLWQLDFLLAQFTTAFINSKV
uniref:Uncharacterized protein n=1 Tax=Tetranychus urticae TaxID=32264 RepID=T1L611_TETUR